MLMVCEPASSVTSVSSNGITWEFSASKTAGLFMTGDPWVVGPVTVNSVTPGWDTNKNGSMVNPTGAQTQQGYDNRSGTFFTYNASLRTTFPVSLSAGDSLVSTVGATTPTTAGGASRIQYCGVLTVVSSPPAANAFRPPAAGTVKTIWTGSPTGAAGSDVDYDLLPGLTPPTGASVIAMTSQGRFLNKIWLEHGTSFIYGSNIFPMDHETTATGGYGYNRALSLGQMACVCLLDTPEAVSVANRLIQYGIDLQAIMATNGRTWSGNGGHAYGRKFPILFAKAMLGEAWTVPYYVSGSSGELKFQEDGYTYDGSGGTDRWGEDCAVTGSLFTSSNHNCRSSTGTEDQWNLSGSEGTSNGGYEAFARTMVGPALAARLLETNMGMMTNWGHAPFFDYVDRWVSTVSGDMSTAGLFGLANTFQIDVNRYSGSGNGFMKRMWETYR
jgi:hypothetical protein